MEKMWYWWEDELKQYATDLKIGIIPYAELSDVFKAIAFISV